MEFIISLLSDPRILSLLSLPVLCMLVLSYALYKMFLKYDALQEQRLTEWKKMNEDYIQLAEGINKTLDLLIKLSGKNGNGNGGGK
jgi:hypothetical protein